VAVLPWIYIGDVGSSASVQHNNGAVNYLWVRVAVVPARNLPAGEWKASCTFSAKIKKKVKT
jgi:hypothetical protein